MLAAASLLLALQNLFNLFGMVDVVPRHHQYEAIDRFVAALRMHSETFPLLRSKRFYESEIHFPQEAELFKRFSRIAFPVIAFFGPGILVVSLDGSARRTQD